MKYVTMGAQKVSAIGLGIWQFGEAGWGWGTELDHEEAMRIVHRALELGINFFDTAEVYGHGRSEEILNQSQGGNYILERWQRHGRCKHQCVGSGL